ncbi:MAG TPA: APC family permease [Caulobacteraceae bacterium]|nr:APC family permease [Caulobacteraceae bacterium]
MLPLHPRPHGLLRVLGVVFSLAVVVGGVIGSGILRAPGVVARGIHTTPMILLAWTIGGVVTLLASMPLVEAGASVPRAGGPFPIAERAFGRTAAFVTGWITWLQYAAGVAFISVVFGEYAHRLGLATAVPIAGLAAALILATAAINWTGTRLSGGSQTIASAVKGAVYFLLAVLLFLLPHGHAPLRAAPTTATALTAVGAVVMAIRVIYQTYAGWDGAIYFSEEVHQPERALARATFTGIGVVSVIYVLINAATLHVITPAEMAGSQLAVGDAARRVLGPVADTVITAFSLFSLAAIANLNLMAGARITWRMAADGMLPRALAYVARAGTPRASLAALVAASLIFAAIGNYELIVRIYSPWNMASILIVCLAAIALRYREPALQRPWKMPLFPWTAIFAALIQAALIVLVVLDDPRFGVWSGLAALAPLPLWLIFGRRALPAMAKGSSR